MKMFLMISAILLYFTVPLLISPVAQNMGVCLSSVKINHNDNILDSIDYTLFYAFKLFCIIIPSFFITSAGFYIENKILSRIVIFIPILYQLFIYIQQDIYMGEISDCKFFLPEKSDLWTRFLVSTVYFFPVIICTLLWIAFISWWIKKYETDYTC